MATKRGAQGNDQGKPISIQVDFGSVKPTKAQQARLKACIDNLVITWAAVDVKATVFQVKSHEVANHPDE